MRHKFRLGTYDIHITEPMQGLCELPSNVKELYMYIPEGKTCEELATILHECCHAQGLPSKYLDASYDITTEIAGILWKMGWRRTIKKGNKNG